MNHRLIPLACAGALSALALSCVPVARAYSAPGHRFVAALAEALLKRDHPDTWAAYRQLLDPQGNFSFARAATIPDEIKTAWDGLLKTKPQTPDLSQPDVTKLTNPAAIALGADWPPALRQAVWTYFLANLKLHHSYHFTDVAIAPGASLAYQSGAVGTTDHDLVRMIPYCVKILHGDEQPDARQITKPVAMVLLLHFMGDLHQPLHVGAEYFQVTNGAAQRVDPNKITGALGDEGGNLIFIREVVGTDGKKVRVIQGNTASELHALWDGDAAEAAFDTWCTQFQVPSAKDAKGGSLIAVTDALAGKLISTVPCGWQFPGITTTDFDSDARLWADDILGLAQEAHERLVLAKVPSAGHAETQNLSDLKITAVLTSADNTGQRTTETLGQDDYLSWAGQQVQGELEKGGWRLAWLLQAAVKQP